MIRIWEEEVRFHKVPSEFNYRNHDRILSNLKVHEVIELAGFKNCKIHIRII